MYHQTSFTTHVSETGWTIANTPENKANVHIKPEIEAHL
jgi:hypothetical protein